MVTFRKMILLYDGQTYIHQKHLTHATCILYNNTKITITHFIQEVFYHERLSIRKFENRRFNQGAAV